MSPATSYRLPSGRTVPTATEPDVRAAVDQAKRDHRTGGECDDPGFRRHLGARAAALNCRHVLPASWGLDQDGAKSLTELAAFAPSRVDLVGSAATGAPMLMMKQVRGTRPPRAAGIVGRVVKADDAQRFTLTLAYPANRPDVSTAQDGYRDFASKAAVEEAAWHYLVNSPVVGLWHEQGTDGAGDVVESSIHRAPDWTVKAADGSEQVIRSGDWLLGIRWSPETWPLVRDGKGRGVSMQGSARRREPGAAALAELGKSRVLAKAAALQDQAGRVPDRAAADYYGSRAARLREQVMSPADHLAKAAGYMQTAARVTDPELRYSYEKLAADERQKAGAR